MIPQSITLIHDSAASRISFVELTFGLNIAFATYERFRAFIKNLLDKSLDEFIAEAISAEIESGKDGKQGRINELKNQIRVIGKNHSAMQWQLCRSIRLLAVISSVACLAVLCFNLIDVLGDDVAYLIAPLPFYVLVSLIIFAGFLIWAWFVKRQYVAFIQKFEKSPAAQIEEGLKELGDDEEDDLEST